MTPPTSSDPRAGAGVTFRLFDGAVHVGLPTADAADALSGVFPAYASTDGGHAANSAFDLRVDGEIWQLATPEGRTHPSASFRDAVNDVEHAVALQLLARADHLPQLHAGGARTGDGAVLALGESGAGKSSLAVQWCLRGHPVYGDDVVFLDDAGRVAPFKRLFSMDPRRLADWGIPANPRLDWLADATGAYFDPGTAAGWATPAPVRTVALAEYAPDASLVITDLPKPIALQFVAASLMPSGQTAAACFDRLLNLIHRARTVRVRFGDARGAADALAAL